MRCSSRTWRTRSAEVLEAAWRLASPAVVNSFGYDVVKRLGSDGQPLRDDRRINEAEADVIRRIFRDYDVGKSPKQIAFELNAEGIAGPAGREKLDASLGSPKRGNGILNNELYIGRIVWNR